MNWQTLEWLKEPGFRAWKKDGLYQKGLALRYQAGKWWQRAENRYGYRSMGELQQRDLAVTTAGLIIQACGRLLRGGVPFRAYFVDAAWGAKTADGEPPDTPDESVLAMMIKVLNEYISDPINAVLYEPLAHALGQIHGFTYELKVNKKPRRSGGKQHASAA